MGITSVCVQGRKLGGRKGGGWGGGGGKFAEMSVCDPFAAVEGVINNAVIICVVNDVVNGGQLPLNQ